MADLLKKGSQFLASRRKASFSQVVTLQRAGEPDTTGVAAAIGKTVDQAYDPGGAIVERETRDFLIEVGDYAFDGVATEPKVGDEIVDPSSGTDITYRVLKRDGGDEAKWHGHYAVTWRVHTKRAS